MASHCPTVGLCPHILVITHLMMAKVPAGKRHPVTNVKFQCLQMGKAKKSGRPKRVGTFLERDDSSDEEEAQQLAVDYSIEQKKSKKSKKRSPRSQEVSLQYCPW